MLKEKDKKSKKEKKDPVESGNMLCEQQTWKITVDVIVKTLAIFGSAFVLLLALVGYVIVIVV